MKSKITLMGVPIAATGSTAWRLTSGIQPYQAVFSCHKSQWPRLEAAKGKPTTMRISNSRDSVLIESVFIVHEVPSDSPNRRSFIVADRRWRWEYRLVTKDYNMVRRTGDRVLIGAKAVDAPVEIAESKDIYYYLPYSLKDDTKRWSPREFLEDVLSYVEPYKDSRVVESFPLFGQDVNRANSDVGGITVQNMMIRDQGNIAMLKALQACPGADVYVRMDGKVAIFDSTSEPKTMEAVRSAKPATWDGQRLAKANRRGIRPRSVAVHFQREVELVLEYEDNFPLEGTTVETTKRGRNDPYVENVMPTVDPETEITEYDPVLDRKVTKTVGMGTFVEFSALLRVWNEKRPPGSMPWTFDTIKKFWVAGELDGALGNVGTDIDPEGNVASRVQMIKQHFRQTFRVNQRIIERVRDIQPIRVFTLDPVTGLRSPALVWGQACIIPTDKSHRISGLRKDPTAKIYRNVDYYPDGSKQTTQTPPGPTRLVMLDRDRGIFRTEWIVSPYGTVEAFVPSLLSDRTGQKPKVLSRDLKQQDKEPMVTGGRYAEYDNSIFLATQCKMKMIVTMVPCAPNDKRQFHVEHIDPETIDDQFAAAFSMLDGQGPEYNLFVAPNETTARFGWLDDEKARETALKLLGLYDDPETKVDESEAGSSSAGVSDDPKTKGVDESVDLPGYEFVNRRATITKYAESVAADILVPFADSIGGTLVTDLNPEATLKGRMAGLTVVANGAPSGKVHTVYDFPGAARSINAKALLPMESRMLLMGIVPFSKPGG